jgi:hypothetical protein
MEIGLGKQRQRVVSKERREMLRQLDDLDFETLKVFESEGTTLDAAQVAGTARLSPDEVVASLDRLGELGLVEVTSPADSPFERRFTLSGEGIAPIA